MSDSRFFWIVLLIAIGWAIFITNQTYENTNALIYIVNNRTMSKAQKTQMENNTAQITSLLEIMRSHVEEHHKHKLENIKTQHKKKKGD